MSIEDFLPPKPLRFYEHIAEAIIRFEYSRSVVRPGRVEVSGDLYGLMLDEMRRDNSRFLPLDDSEDAYPMKIRGFPIVPVYDMKPLEWSIVPA